MEQEQQQQQVSSVGQRRFTGGRIVLAVALLLVALAAFVLWLGAPPDPVYKGKHLSTYLFDAAAPIFAPNGSVNVQAIREAERKQAEMAEATKALGARTIPLLTVWWEADSGIRARLRKLASKPGSRFAWLWRWRWIAMDLHSIAENALMYNVAEHAESFIPALRKEMFGGKPPSSTEAQFFVRILHAVPVQETYYEQNRDILEFYTADSSKELGDPAVEVIASILRHGPPEDSERLIRRLWPYRNRPFTSVRSVISQFDPDGFTQNILYLEDGKPTEKPAAALYFKDKPCQPERVVPLLVTNLTPTASANLLQNVCDALAAYGTNATPALPQLTNLLAHPKAVVREAAERAVMRIEGR